MRSDVSKYRPTTTFLSTLFLVVGAFLAAVTAQAADFTSSSFTVKDPVLAPSGYATSSSYSITATIGQPSVGTSTAPLGSVNELRSGFGYFPFINRPVVTITPGDGFVGVSWTASTGFLGWTVSGYNVGKSTVSGGPYTYFPVSPVTNTAIGALTNETTYYFVVIAKDFFGNFIATSEEVTGTPSASIRPLPTPPPIASVGGGKYFPPYATTTIPSMPPLFIPPLFAPPSAACRSIADLNCEGYVDIIDFSIMYYWFDQTNPPERVDLTRDGKVDIADFSVMAYYWHESNERIAFLHDENLQNNRYSHD